MSKINNKQFPLFPPNMDKFVNELLRNQVKEYLRYKSHTNPEIIIKENFILGVVKSAINTYYSELLKKELVLRHDDMLNLNSDIIAAITERHVFYSFKTTERERLALQDSSKYKNKLIRETVDDLIINKYLGQVSFNMTTAYFPPVSKIMVINNLLYELFTKVEKSTFKDSKHIAISHVFMRIIEQVKSCSLLLDKYMFADTIAIWRGLFESELTLTVLSYWNENISKEYLEFVEFQLLENNIVYNGKIKEEVDQRLEAKAIARGVKKSKNFIHYGWLMQTQEYYDNNCKLSLKDGLAVVADKYVKYTDYQLASNISHSPYFSKQLNQAQLMQYVVEIIAYSLDTIINAILNYMEEENQEIDKDILDQINASLAQLLDMCETIIKNNE